MKIAEQDILNQFTADKDLMTILTMIRSLQLKIVGWLLAVYEILSGIICQINWDLIKRQTLM